jgi:ketosteroid isomerase-like protein
MKLDPPADARFAIQDLFAKYAWAVDTADVDTLVTCWTEDGVLIERPPDILHGRSEIGAFMNRMFFSSGWEFSGRQHSVSQMLYSPDPDSRENHWRVRTYWRGADRRVSRSFLYAIGYYDDIVTKVDDAYLFRSRAIRLWAGDVLSRFPDQTAGGGHAGRAGIGASS